MSHRRRGCRGWPSRVDRRRESAWDPGKRDVCRSILTAFAVIGGLILVMGILSLFEGAVVGARRWQVLRGRRRAGRSGACLPLRLQRESRIHSSGLRAAGDHAGRDPAGSTPGSTWASSSSHRRPGLAGRITARAGRRGERLASVSLWPLALRRTSARRIAQRWPEQIARAARPSADRRSRSDRSPGPTHWAAWRNSLPDSSAVQSATRPPITHEEIKGLVWEGAQAGVFDEAEHEILKRAFRFCERRRAT